jgi:RNA polymerase sigma-70 factor, ECF subfamily
MVDSLRRSLASHVVERLYHASGASRWDVTRDAFAGAVDASVEHRFRGESPDRAAVEAFAATLHVADLGLAVACRAGHEAAWEHFMRELRPPMYAAARATAGEERARDLVEPLFADLFGLSERDGERRSLLVYYHGRSRLSTWLRTVLAQRHVDAIRAAAKVVPLDESADEPAAGGVVIQSSAAPPDPDRTRFVRLAQEALDASIAALDAQDRLRLRLYYGQGVRLARIGVILGEHEATASRKLDRARREIRDGVRQVLAARGLGDVAIDECLAAAAAAPELDAGSLLGADEP